MRRKILIIDDNLDTSMKIENILEGKGYLIFTASNPDLALSMVRDINPSLIFVSLTMPDGLEICKRIHTLPAFSKIPIIVFTSPERGIKAAPESEYGIVDSLDRSFSPEELILKTETVLSIKEITETVPRGISDIPYSELVEPGKPIKQSRYEERPFSGPEPWPSRQDRLESGSDFMPIRDEVEGLIDKSFESKQKVSLPEKPQRQKRKGLLLPLGIASALGVLAMIYFIWQKAGIEVRTSPPRPITKAVPSQPTKEQAPEQNKTVETKEEAIPEKPLETKPEAPPEKIMPFSFYSAQVGVFKYPDNAEAYVKRLKGKGYDAFIQIIMTDDQMLHKVLVGKFENKKDAEELISTLKSKENIKAVIFSSR